MAINEIGLLESVSVVGTTANVRDFGALGNDIHDDTLAFRNALNSIRSTGGTCFVPIGTYKIASTGITGRNDVPAITHDMHLVGEDKTRSVLHVHDVETKTIIVCDGDRWSIENLTIQMSGDYPWNPNWHHGDPLNDPPKWIAGAGAVTVKPGQPSSHRWKIDNCRMVPTTTGGHTNCSHFLVVARGTHWTISNNYFQGVYPQATGGSPVHEGIIVDGSGDSPTPAYGTYINNVFDGVGSGTSGNNHLIKQNRYFNHCYGTMFSAASIHGPVSFYNRYIGNVVTQGREGWIDDIGVYDRENDRGAWGGGGGGEMWAPHSLYLRNHVHDTPGYGLMIGGHNSVAAFNNIISVGKPMFPDYSEGRHRHRPGLLARSLIPEGLRQHNAGGSVFIGNLCTDHQSEGHKTQTYGIAVQTDWIRCVCSIANNLHGNELGEGFYRNCQPNVNIAKGRDMIRNVCDEQQRDILMSLLDKDQYTITEDQYVMLNQLLAG